MLAVWRCPDAVRDSSGHFESMLVARVSGVRCLYRHRTRTSPPAPRIGQNETKRPQQHSSEQLTSTKFGDAFSLSRLESDWQSSTASFLDCVASRNRRRDCGGSVTRVGSSGLARCIDTLVSVSDHLAGRSQPDPGTGKGHGTPLPSNLKTPGCRQHRLSPVGDWSGADQLTRDGPIVHSSETSPPFRLSERNFRDVNEMLAASA